MENKETIEQLSFEAAMDKLEEIVARLEGGDTPLEQSIELFQEGMLLSKLCSEKLDRVEQKIEMVTEHNGAWKRESYATEETGDPVNE